MFKALAALTFLLPSCRTTQHLLKLADGEIITCEEVEAGPCGLDLAGCGRDQERSLACLKDVTYLRVESWR